MKKITLCFLGCLLSFSLQAQRFEIKNASKFYDAKIDVGCEQNECSGHAKIELYKKGQKQVFQRFESDGLSMELDQHGKPSSNIVQMYGEKSALIFDDFNFDGQQDLAIRSGDDGPYGGPTYDIYVFNRTRHAFVLSAELSDLTQENLGMFSVDAKHQRIGVMSKSGCCWHLWQQYQVVPNKGLKLVYTREEDAMSTMGEKVIVTERKLIQGKWKTTVKKYPIKTYYGE